MPSNLFSAENAAMIELFDDDDDDGEKTSDLENKSPLISRAGAVSAVAPLSEQDFLHAEKDNKIQDIVCVTLEEPSGMENGPCTAPSSKPNLFESSAFASFDMDSMFGEDDEL